MKFRIPDYYDKFKCIGSDCTDSCCAGWDITVNDETYEKYTLVKGSFGDRLMRSVSSSCPHHFLMEERRCPFLNQKNLCDIYIHLGEDFLCQICTDHPRFYEVYGSRQEAGLGLVCEEAARLILTNKKKVRFLDKNLDEKKEEEEPWLEPLTLARDLIIRLLQDREQTLERRLRQTLSAAAVFQEDYIRDDMEAMYLHIHKWKTKERVQKPRIGLREWFTECLEFLLYLEILTPEWKQALSQASFMFREGDICFSDFDGIFYEHLMVYFIYRYFLRSVYDFQLLDKVKFAVFSCLAVRGTEAAASGEGSLTSLEIARLYSKEIEYSEENMEAVNEQILFSDMFDTQRLSEMVSAVFRSSYLSEETGRTYE